MTDIAKLTDELFRRIEWQKTPEEVCKEDIAGFILVGIKDLYVITGRGMLYSDRMIVWDGEMPTKFSEDLKLDELEYVLLSAQIAFFEKVKTDVNNMVGYTTNALSVTHADRPYKYLSDTVAELTSRRKTLWFKMARYNL